MMSNEVSQIQEVRYCLKSLREQMASRNNNGKRLKEDWVDGEDGGMMREASCLNASLQEAEQKYQEELEKLQAENRVYQQQLREQGARLEQVQQEVEAKDQHIEELQSLRVGMEQESAALQEKMSHGQVELRQLRSLRQEAQSRERRSEQLEKEVAALKEKIHHLDDMLMSQQRKVRHMIEQLQNSQTVIQGREGVIRDLEEKVAFLEAENREMRDQNEHFLGGRRTSSEHKAQIVHSQLLTPSSATNKPLPLIKVVEVKS